MAEEISRLKKEEAENEYEETAAHNDMVDWEWGSSWTVGLVFILIGGGLLVANFTDFRFDNWWALFFLVPAVLNFGKAAQSYSRRGYFTSSSAGMMSSSFFLIFLGAMFLFGLDWGIFWPAIFIVIGLSSLVKGMARS